MSHRSVIASIGFLVGTLAVVWCARAETIDEYLNTATGRPGTNVTDAFRGQLRSKNVSVLSAGVAARIIRFPVSTGDRVKAGDTLAAFDCDLAEVDNQIGRAREDAAARNLDINKRLSALKNLSALDLSLSTAELAIASGEVARTETILAECELTAPFSGTVTQKFAQAHEYVNLGDPMLELVDTRNLEVEMVLPSRVLSTYQRGVPFSLRLDETGNRVEVQVDRVVNVIDPVSQTLRVIGVLTSEETGLMPGMSGVVTIADDVTIADE